jgi:ribonuclease P protein component
VVHLVAPEAPRPPFDTHEVSPRVGFVVGRAVGNSVLRHRVLRRLRHLCRDRLSILPGGAELVVRALAPAGAASYQELGADLDRCLERALADHGPGPGTVS